MLENPLWRWIVQKIVGRSPYRSAGVDFFRAFTGQGGGAGTPFPEVVVLSDEEVRGETEDWMARGLAARSLSQKITAEPTMHEFQ